MLFFLLIPKIIFSQVEPDFSRPFNQGSVILLPGTSAYSGDLPHSIFTNPERPTDSIAGWLGPHAGWFGLSGASSSGFRPSAPGLFFEGIPYPFPSFDILSWLPVNASFQFLDFPAASWWGTKGSAGAVQFDFPKLNKMVSDEFTFWGGNEEIFGVSNIFKYTDASILLNYQHGTQTLTSGSGKVGIQSSYHWLEKDSMVLETGLMAAQNTNNDNWYSVFTSLLFPNANFQTLQIKPFFQTAQSKGKTIQEIGGQINYHLNLGGFVESHLGFGYSQLFPDGDLSRTNKGYVQGTALGDFLGMATFDAAFRFDFSNQDNTLFSYLIGLQGNDGNFTLFCDIGKNPFENKNGEWLKLNAGLRFQPDANLSSTLKIIYQELGGNSTNGLYFSGQIGERRPLLMIFQRMMLKIEEQLFIDPTGTSTMDSCGTIQVSFFKQDNFYARGRMISGHPPYLEIGGDYEFSKDLFFFAALINLGNVPVFWNDPDQAKGVVFRAGINGQF